MISAANALSGAFPLDWTGSEFARHGRRVRAPGLVQSLARALWKCRAEGLGTGSQTSSARISGHPVDSWCRILTFPDRANLGCSLRSRHPCFHQPSQGFPTWDPVCTSVVLTLSLAQVVRNFLAFHWEPVFLCRGTSESFNSAGDSDSWFGKTGFWGRTPTKMASLFELP